MYTLVECHLSRVHLSRANFLYSHDLSDAQLTWNKVTLNVRSSDGHKVQKYLVVCLFRGGYHHPNQTRPSTRQVT